MNEFEHAVSYALDEESNMNSMKSITDWINKRIRVYKDTDGEWKVELVKGGN